MNILTKVKKFIFAISMTVLLIPCLVLAKPVIVLDAAHGGDDSGVKAGSEVEKEWNLKFTQALQKALESAGFDVVQVRKRDETLPQNKRVEMINTSQASAALVIHADREWTGTKSGPMIVVEPPNQGEESPEILRWGVITPYQYRTSLKLGRDIAQALGAGTELSSLSDTRGLAGETTAPDGKLFCLPHQSLRYITIPAVVLTPLFLSSTSDLKKYSHEEAVDELATKVARGLENFLQ